MRAADILFPGTALLRSEFASLVADDHAGKLTVDGNERIFNGKSDWVYTEEIFNRRDHAFWWSPDSTRIAFIRYDDTPVNAFTHGSSGPS